MELTSTLTLRITVLTVSKVLTCFIGSAGKRMNFAGLGDRDGPCVTAEGLTTSLTAHHLGRRGIGKNRWCANSSRHTLYAYSPLESPLAGTKGGDGTRSAPTTVIPPVRSSAIDCA